MPQVVLCGISALKFYRKMRYQNDVPEKLEKVNLGSINKKSIRDYNFDEYLNRENKIDILVKDENHKRKIDGFTCHYNIRNLDCAFRKIRNFEYVISPEFMFVQLAGILPFGELLCVGLEICGKYTLFGDMFHSFIGCECLTTPEKILSFCQLCSKKDVRFCGINRARYALKYIKAGSASPAETLLFVKLCAPTCKGGYGLAHIDLNKKINLSNSAKKIIGQACVFSDLSNKSKKLSIEYDSEQFHDNEHQNRRDKRRIDGFIHDNWTVFSLVDVQVNNRFVFDTLAKKILKTNGQSARIRVKNFFQKQTALWQELSLYK